ncbi:MAG: ice-binding family protein [Bacteroidota bacterium]
MRTDKHFFKSIALTTLWVTSLATAGISQDLTTIVEPEAETPIIVSTSPSGNAMNVEPGDVIEITFSNEMDGTTIDGTTLLLQANYADTASEMHGQMRNDQIRGRAPLKKSGNSMQYSTSAVSGSISYSDKTALFTPISGLKEGTLYTFTVTTGVKNSENIALENDHNWSFTTAGTPGTAYSDNQVSTYGMQTNETDFSTTYALLTENQTTIDLGTAGLYVILAKDSIHTKSESRITGQTGEGSLADSAEKENNGISTELQADSDKTFVLQSNQNDKLFTDVTAAIEDMMKAYDDVSAQEGDSVTSQAGESFHTTELLPGVHQWSDSLYIESNVTLSGGANDVWIFKTGENLVVDENTVFTLTNGARAENIIWHAEGNVTIGPNARFEGIILSMNNITMEKGATLNGRMYSQTSVSLDDNTVTEPALMEGQTSSANR